MLETEDPHCQFQSPGDQILQVFLLFQLGVCSMPSQLKRHTASHSQNDFVSVARMHQEKKQQDNKSVKYSLRNIYACRYLNFNIFEQNRTFSFLKIKGINNQI